MNIIKTDINLYIQRFKLIEQQLIHLLQIVLNFQKLTKAIVSYLKEMQVLQLQTLMITENNMHKKIPY